MKTFKQPIGRQGSFTAMVLGALMVTNGLITGRAQGEPANVPPATEVAPRDEAVRRSLSAGAAAVLQLENARVDDAVLSAYIWNANTPFNLTAAQKNYLRVAGLTSELLQEMETHDAAALGAEPTLPISSTNNGTTYSNVAVSNRDNSADAAEFYEALAGAGNWSYVNGIGLCWQPAEAAANADWQPYQDRGRWLFTAGGWYWQSDYAWGWAAFHYGRWFQNGVRGWAWVPERVWAPAWVSWRRTADYCGWAPLPPSARFAPETGMTSHSRPATDKFSFGLAAQQYTFVPVERMVDYTPARYALTDWQLEETFAASQLINHFVWQNGKVANAGISPQEVATRSHVPVREVQVKATPPLYLRGSQALAEITAPVRSSEPHDIIPPQTILNGGYPEGSLIVVGPKSASVSETVARNAGTSPYIYFAPNVVPQTQNIAAAPAPGYPMAAPTYPGAVDATVYVPDTGIVQSANSYNNYYGRDYRHEGENNAVSPSGNAQRETANAAPAPSSASPAAAAQVVRAESVTALAAQHAEAAATVSASAPVSVSTSASSSSGSSSSSGKH